MPESLNIDVFRPVVEVVFNNWTALRLAVEHGLGGPASKQIAIQLVDYLTQYCCGNDNVDSYEITDILEDVLNEEFNTICEDNSQKEIADILVRYMKLINEGNLAVVQEELSHLKPCDLWLCQTGPRQTSKEQSDENETDDSDSSSDEDIIREVDGSTQDEPMEEEDDGWTVVRRRR